MNNEFEIVYDDIEETFVIRDFSTSSTSEPINSVAGVADILQNVYDVIVTEETIKNITLLKLGQEVN